MLNPEYAPMLEQLKQHFVENGQITLRECIAKEQAKKILDNLDTGVQSFELMSHKYTLHQLNDAAKELLASEELTSFLKQLIGQDVEPKEVALQSYSHGDFLLRRPCGSGILCIIDFGDEFPEGIGGDFCYATEQDTAIIPSAPRSLSLLHVDTETEEFLTYITHHAGQARRISLSFYL